VTLDNKSRRILARRNLSLGRHLMRTSFAVLVCLVLVPITTPAAWAQEFAWAKGIGGPGLDGGGGVAADSNGNVYITGSFSGTVDFDPGPGTYYLTATDDDIFILKLNSLGNFVWVKQVVGGGYDVGNNVTLDSSNNLYTVGTFQKTADFDPGPGTHNLDSTAGGGFILKLDSLGNFVWVKQHPETCSDVVVDSSGNVYVTGYDSDDKLDSSGNLVWRKQRIGDSAWGQGIAADSGGNVYTAGYFAGTVDFDPGPGTYYLTNSGPLGNFDIFISKLDSLGILVWVKQMVSASPFAYNEIANGITVDSSGNVYTTGYFVGMVDFNPGPDAYFLTSDGYDIFISKLDSLGNFVWAKQMGGPQSGSDSGNRITTDLSGNLYIVGHYQNSADLDPGPDTHAFTCGIGYYCAFISKLDNAGSYAWAGSMGGGTDTSANGISLDSGGNAYTVGYYRNSGDFDPGPGTFQLGPAGNTDIFAVKLNGCGSSFVDQSAYGQLLFPPLCTRDASVLTQNIYSSTSLGMFAGSHDRFFLSSAGGAPTGQVLGSASSPLVVDDAVHINGLDAGLGPYTYQPGVPPFLLDVPIERNLAPLPSHEVTNLIPKGQSSVLFELLDTQREIYGNTAVYLVRDCGIWLAGNNPTSMNWITHDDQVTGISPEFDVRYGFLSNLRTDRNFSRATCLGRFFSTPATESLPGPPLGEGYYYLARGVSMPGGLQGCAPQGYGDCNCSLVPDPRDALDALPVCP